MAEILNGRAHDRPLAGASFRTGVPHIFTSFAGNATPVQAELALAVQETMRRAERVSVWLKPTHSQSTKATA